MATTQYFGAPGNANYEGSLTDTIKQGVFQSFDPLGLMTSKPIPYVDLGQTSKYDPTQQAVLQQLMNYISPFITGQTQIPSYTGQFTAPMTPLQNQTISNLGQLTNVNSPLNSDLLTEIKKFATGSNFDPSYMRTAYTEGIEKPLIKNFKENIIPTIDSATSKSGNFYGTGRAKAIDDEATTLMDALAQGRSSLESSIYSTGQQNQLAGIQNFSNFIQQMGGLNTIAMAAGAKDQSTQQDLLNKLFAQWQTQNVPGAQPYDTLLQSILNLYPMYQDQVITSNADTSTNLFGKIGSILGGGGSGGGGGLSGIMSLFG